MSICIEKKVALSGNTYSFECELLFLNNKLGILKYVIDRSYDIQTVKLRPNDITYALYWTDRPYTLYVWHFLDSKTAYYFNIADSISLQPTAFVWRDLAIDILVDAEGQVHILDEDELPADLSCELSASIRTAKAFILQNYSELIKEANSLLARFMNNEN